MKKWVIIFLALAMFALFSSGCAGVYRSGPGFTSDGRDGFEPTTAKDLNYYQMHGY